MINFKIEKVKKDIFNYLDSEYPNQNSYNLKLRDITNYKNSSKITTISENDSIKLLHLKEMIDLYWNDKTYEVKVGIGEYKDKGRGVFRVGKCVANLQYDDQLKLLDIDFIYDYSCIE